MSHLIVAKPNKDDELDKALLRVVEIVRASHARAHKSAALRRACEVCVLLDGTLAPEKPLAPKLPAIDSTRRIVADGTRGMERGR